MRSQSRSLLQLSIYGLASATRNALFWLVTIFYFLYSTAVLHADVALLISIIFAVKIISALVLPVCGLLIDKTKSRCGRFKPWIMAGAVINTVFLSLIFLQPDLSPEQRFPYLTLMFVLWNLSFIKVYLPAWSMLPSLGSSAAVRDLGAVMLTGGVIIGSNLILLSAAPIVKELSLIAGSAVAAYQIMAFIGALILILVHAMMCLLMKTPDPPRGGRKFGPIGLLRYGWNNRPLKIVMFISFMQQAAAVIMISALTMYVIDKDPLDLGSSIGGFITDGAICQILALLLFPIMTAKSSRKLVFNLSCALMASGCALMLLISLSGLIQELYLSIAFCIASFGIALNLASACVMTADSVDYGEFKLNRRCDSSAFAFLLCAGQIGSCIAIAATGMTVLITGRISSALPIQPQMMSLRFSLTIAILILLCMIFIYKRFYNLNGNLYKNMLANLEQLRAKSMSMKATHMPLRYALDQNFIFIRSKASSVNEVTAQLINSFAAAGILSSSARFTAAVQNRLKRGPCGIAEGIAIPHAHDASVLRPAIGLSVLQKPIDCGSADGRKCDLIFLIASPDDGRTHLNLLGGLSLALNEPGFADKLRQAGSSHEIMERLVKSSQHLAL